MTKRGPLSGSGVVSVAGSGFGGLTVGPVLLVVFRADVLGFGVVTAGGASSSFVFVSEDVSGEVFSAVVFSATFGLTGVVVLLAVGLRVRGGAFDAVAFGAGSFFTTTGDSGASEGEGSASGVGFALAISGVGSGSGNRAPTDETRFVFLLPLAIAELVVVSWFSTISGLPATGSKEPPNLN